MKRKTIVSVVICLVLSVLCLSGCGETASENSADNKAENDSQLEIYTGIVKTIDADNNKITINVMDNSRFDKVPPSGENGEMPEGFDGKMPEDFDGEPPENFDGEKQKEFKGKKPEDFDGEPPQGENGERPEFKEGEMPENMEEMSSHMEEKTYTVSSGVFIQDEDGNTIELKDIAEGVFAEFTVEDDEITSLSLKKNRNEMDKEEQSDQ